MNITLKEIPAFFLVGGPKCGTTSLHYYLQQHPDIYMPDVKEPHFFCFDFHEQSDAFHKRKRYFPIRSMKQYKALFKEAKEHQIIGEASTTYAFSKMAAEEIKKANPAAKIIIVLREPVAQAYSWFYFSRFRSHETLENFEEAIREEPFRMKDWSLIPSDAVYPLSVNYSYIAEGSTHLQRFLDHFDKDKVMFIIYDDLRKNKEKIFKEILSFIGANTDFQPDFKNQNITRTVKSVGTKRIVDRILYPLKVKLYRFRNTGFLKGLKKAYMSTFTKEDKRPPLHPEVEARLKSRYKNTVEELSSLTGRDLVKLWNY